MSTPLRVLSGGAAQALMRALAAREGVTLEGSFGAVGAMKEKLLAGEAADLVVLTAALIGELARAGRVRADSVADLGRVRTGIAVRAADPKPDVSDAAALRAALLAADAVYCPDTERSTAGIHFARVLDGLGVRAELGARLRSFPNGATAMAELARDKSARAIGCTQVTEILPTAGIALVAPLPQAYELVTVYTGAVNAAARDAAGAERFLRLLTGEAARALRAASGFED